MALPNVSVQIQNGGLGRVTVPDDRVCALVVNGVNDRPIQIFGLADITNHATMADVFYRAEYKRQVQEFYAEAGDGAELWLQPVSATTSSENLFTGGILDNLMRVSAGRVNVIGISRYVDNEVVTQLEGLDAGCLNALDEAQAFAVNCATTLHAPVRIIMDGKNMVNDPTLIRDLTSNSFNRVAVLVGSTQASPKTSAMGLLLGRIASTPVHYNIGRVKSGQVAANAAYLTNGLAIESFSTGALNALNNKGYIFLRKHIGKGGYYWNDDHMAVANTDDFYCLAYGRTIDKAARIAYATFLEELLDTVQVDPTTGRIAATTIKQYQVQIERAIGLNMAANGEISGVEAYIDPAQDILATSTLTVKLQITPVGTNRVIVVKLGLTNPNAA